MEDNNKSVSEQLTSAGSTFQETEERDFDFRNYLLAILNRRWLVFTVMSFVVLTVFLYSVLQTRVYQSKAVLEVDLPGTFGFASDPAATPFYWENRDSFMNTQFRVLKSKNLAKRVAEKLNLTLRDVSSADQKETKRGSLKPLDRSAEIEAVAGTLLGMVQINPILGTNLCEVIFKTATPTLSMKLANAWAEQYVEYRLESMQEYTQNAEDLLKEQVQFLQKEVADKEKALRDYSLEKQIVKPEGTRSMASAVVTDLNNALMSATKDRISEQVRYQALKSASIDSIPEVASHTFVQQARNQYSSLERTYTEKSKVYKPDYPEMIRLRSEMQQARSDLDTQAQRAYQEVLASANAAYQEAAVRESALRNQLEDAKRHSVEAGRKEFPYDQLVMEIDNKKQLLTLLLQKQGQTDVSAQAQGRKVTTTRIMENAELPTKVYSPDIPKNMLFSLLAGLLAGISLALLLEFFDRSIKSPDDLEKFLHLPYLGVVPHYTFESGNGHKEVSKPLLARKPKVVAPASYRQDLLSSNDPMSSASEAVKMVRTALLLACPDGPPRSLLITSSRAGEGKTFIACNLAVALTQLEKKVVIVDADMRNPRIHRIWSLTNDIGLSIYLTTDATAESVLHPTPVNGLFVIPSGPKTPRPAELLASARFEALMTELQNNFDFVILDSPPILPVTDSVILASRAKGVILVVHGGDTPREIVKVAKRKLASSNAVILGTVLNGINFEDPYYYYRYYSGYYYSYYGKNDEVGKSTE